MVFAIAVSYILPTAMTALLSTNAYELQKPPGIPGGFYIKAVPDSLFD
jgi:hypothetical protein